MPQPSRSSELAAALLRLENSEVTDQPDAELFFGARGDDLERLLVVASRLRDEGLARSGRAGIITYSKKVFIPVTQLCQDRCHYCIFVDTPGGLAKRNIPVFMSPEEILEVARQGAAMGCKEALFTLGDRPENRWPSARQWLDDHGYESTLDYIRAMAILVLEETGLLPHLNPGVMSWSELQRLRPVAPSMGMMLETTATRLWSEKGGVHYGSPDKDPAIRLRVLEDAGRSRIPFTTGVLLGIGENDAERAEALFEIRRSHERHGHIQETIVQNFRAKPRTAMQNEEDLALQEYVAAVAVARIVMGPDATIQAPPNLTDAQELGLLLRAGIDDWGGVSPLTPDHVNPERPWPELEALARLTRDGGFELRERLTAHPDYIRDEETWLDSRLRTPVRALTDPNSGLAREDAPVVGRPWVAEPEGEGGILTALLDAAELAPDSLADADYAALLGADGADLERLAGIADALRASTVGDELSFVINRNLDLSLYDPERSTVDSLDLALIRALADEAKALGATELCLQGAVPEGQDGAYFEIIGAIRAAQPDLHIHSLRPVEIANAAGRLGKSVAEFISGMRAAGANSIPGTGARILDDRIRAVLSDSTDPPVQSWIEVISTAHSLGLGTTATMVYGHIESPANQVAHLRLLARLQDETGGFTEFIPMPYLPLEASPTVAAVAGAGPSLRQSRALHAVARLMLTGRIDHIQAAWTKLGLAGAEAVLRGGADDLGGLLLGGTLARTAGAEAHRELSLAEVQTIAAELGRPLRQRTTGYATVRHIPARQSRRGARMLTLEPRSEAPLPSAVP
ncbi:7,8-didemethyl-8-hydroxy-5-deazariboflavin synthase subunit CofG [Glaciihabitans sp. INWT7]|uniref:7,8-didemethyl-8-hydroxy-5-deazariboflavin synthase CofG n=1 Tax=Glaciihabitans sp. INWT7 TaxID=2596912 RepID=UPI001625E833|nr:7,8-didemethyl-8-hydroxy-5-deazariboflavin synthase CofG [Glaciihabitans sp. INWT7]QNE47489.1 7,8-didemethyl-8-hydroxy-5-deazariboflavin synthase subunit CofG [Glaciihabitans sp. INWT7]